MNISKKKIEIGPLIMISVRIISHVFILMSTVGLSFEAKINLICFVNKKNHCMHFSFDGNGRKPNGINCDQQFWTSKRREFARTPAQVNRVSVRFCLSPLSSLFPSVRRSLRSYVHSYSEARCALRIPYFIIFKWTQKSERHAIEI